MIKEKYEKQKKSKVVIKQTPIFIYWEGFKKCFLMLCESDSSAVVFLVLLQDLEIKNLKNKYLIKLKKNDFFSKLYKTKSFNKMSILTVKNFNIAPQEAKKMGTKVCSGGGPRYIWQR